uniref:DNA helicase n=1 Tax=Ditylenchus dipsaci TaxID=166011 RepID=A0A915DY36_9BILA
MSAGPGEQEFAEWLEQVGRVLTWQLLLLSILNDHIELLDEIAIVNSEQAIVEQVYYKDGSLAPNLNNRLILCPLNRDVDRYNRRILDLLPERSKHTFLQIHQLRLILLLLTLWITMSQSLMHLTLLNASS